MRKLTMDELNRCTVEEFKNKKKNQLVILLDDVRSLNNVGSAFRTGDAFLVEKIILCGITGTPPHRDINKTALGATESVEWEYKKEAIEAIHQLKKEGYTVISIEQTEGAIPLQNFEFEKEKKYCVIFGNEAFGVNDKLIELSDFSIEIPQLGTKHSLNISVTVGIVVWDYCVKINKTALI
ncbi:MAG TPA: RNA methyltransferase [Cytophagales bacterium]|nr:RNA methyltransferase [Cytophagales bacterium]